MAPMSNTLGFTAKSIPPDLPLGGMECQRKSAPPLRCLSVVSEKSLLLVSVIAMKLRRCSLDKLDQKLYLAKSPRPLLFQKIPFIMN
jgi:hypothetical protein